MAIFPVLQKLTHMGQFLQDMENGPQTYFFSLIGAFVMISFNMCSPSMTLPCLKSRIGPLLSNYNTLFTAPSTGPFSQISLLF